MKAIVHKIVFSIFLLHPLILDTMQNENSLNTVGTNLVESSTKMSTNLYSKFYSNTDSSNEDDSDSDEEYIKPFSAMNVKYNGTVEKCQNNMNENDEECDYGYSDDIEDNDNRIDGERHHHHVRRNSCLINKEKNILTTIVESSSILGIGSDCLVTSEMDGPPRMSDRDLKYDQKRKADIVIAMYNQ